MRMRKKKHLEERLAQCKNVITLLSDDCNFNTAIEKKEYIDMSVELGFRSRYPMRPDNKRIIGIW